MQIYKTMLSVNCVRGWYQILVTLPLCLVQRALLSKSVPLLEQTVLDLCCTTLPDTIAIADLGCSSGPNTFFAVSKILTIIAKRHRQLGRPTPGFWVFLNDLPGNDFNSVFKSLPTFHDKMRIENGDEFGPCYVAAVPGSFYHRLFPSRSLHFLHSSCSLHWLSQVRFNPSILLKIKFIFHIILFLYIKSQRN